jgi:UDP-N-acetylglucosamine 2-epimerase (non-hydrolysing)
MRRLASVTRLFENPAAAAVKTIVHVIGARPNYMKIAPLMRALDGDPRIRQILVNTGQHYDDAMARAFVRDLDLPIPDYDLDVGSASHAVQTARVMIKFEEVCLQERPDLVVVVGDVNSTMAASLVAAKLLIPIAHVEAGLRSHDRTMPEEINRIVTDRLSDVLLTPSPDADRNLLAEGVPPERIHLVGNIMIDSLLRHLAAADLNRLRDRVNVIEKQYAVLTLHRPSNVDQPDVFSGILTAMTTIADRMPVVFPIHPRTRQRVKAFGFESSIQRLLVTEPLGYIDFLSLTSHARLILTDSGGLQEESTALGIPCLTLRENTERPVTVTDGTNQIVGTDTQAILAGVERALAPGRTPRRPDLWDGRAAERMCRVLRASLGL